MRDEDYTWFLAHYQELHKKYGTSFLVIKDKTVLGAYPTYAAGVKAGSANNELGTFIVQKCNGDESGYTEYMWNLQLT